MNSGKITLLRVLPTVNLFCHGFWQIIWKYIWQICSDILFCHSIWHLFWHSFWHGHCRTSAGPQPRAPDISGHRGWDPAVLSEIWSSLLGGWGRRKKDEGRRKKDEEVTLIKSRDLYLAGGEQLKIWKTETVWICAISSKKHMKIQCFTRKQQLGLPDPTRSISSSWPTFAQAFCQAWRRGEFSSWFNPIDSLLYPQKITKHSHIYRLYIYRICIYIYILYRIIYSEYNIYMHI